MEDNLGYLIAFFVGTLSSLFATWIYFKRRQKIKDRIKDLEFEKKFITNISTSSGEFVRFNHESVMFVLFLICLANLIPLVSDFITNEKELIFSEGLIISTWGAAGMLALKDYSRSVKSKNLTRFKAKTDEKINKLKLKLDE